jgi:adenosine kinase
MLQVPNATGYFGAIGKDHYGEKLKQTAESGGVKTHYVVLDNVQTGTCAVLVEAKERCFLPPLSHI